MRTMAGSFNRAAIAALVLSGFLFSSAPVAGASAEIDAHVRQTIENLYKTSSAAKDLAAKSAGMLVFPTVVKGGFVVGAEYGEGALLVGGKTAAYYSIASGSLGLQIGVQEKSVVLLFMTAEALTKFRESQGWKAGVDGSVALANLGAGDAIDTETMKKPIIGFVFNNKGLMANLTLEGSKITRIDR